MKLCTLSNVYSIDLASSLVRLFRSNRLDMCGEDREVPGDVPPSIRTLHQLSQAQHSSFLAQAADEGDGPAHDRSLPRQSLPAHEGGMPH